MFPIPLRAIAGFATVAASLVLAAAAPAQTGYPDKPIRIIAPVQPGGGVDLVARTIAERLGRALNQSIVALKANGLASVTSIAAMKGFKFGAQIGTTSLDTINNVIKPTAKAKVYTTNDEAIAENPGPVEQFRGGKDGAINALVGQVMKKSRGSANPQVVQQILRQRLSGS